MSQSWHPPAEFSDIPARAAQLQGPVEGLSALGGAGLQGSRWRFWDFKRRQEAR